MGTIEGVDHSHVSFTERAGVVAGVISAGPETYEIRTAASGVYTLERLDESRFGAEQEPLVDPSAVEHVAPPRQPPTRFPTTGA